jgi:ABC-type glycerol-3-phosphate transport system substrate-binding protein
MRKALVRKACALAILLATIIFLLAGCAGQAGNSPGAPSQQATAQESPKVVAYKTLATAGKTYNATMKSLGDLYRQKLIDDQVKAKAIEYGTAFQHAYNQALDAAEKNDFSSVSGVSVALADLLDFVQPYLIKGGEK